MPAPFDGAISGSLHLTQRQLDELVEDCEPDAALDFFADYSPELIPRDLTPLRLYQAILEVFRLANAHRVEAWPDKMALATAELLVKGGVRGDPRLTRLLISRAWEPGKLHVALQAHGLL
jgi:hypothetical protein